MQSPSGVIVQLVIILITVLPLAPSAGDMDLPGRGEQEAPTDQPTRRPPPDSTEEPAVTEPAPTEQATEPEPDDMPGDNATDPFGAADSEEEAEGAGPVATILVWGFLVVAAGGLVWLGWRYLRR